MKWQLKAASMKIASAIPGGELLYRFGQRRFGRLDGNPMRRLPVQARLATTLQQAGGTVIGKKFLEVGTGHVPLVPIGFFLCGAERVTTVDLHQRIDLQKTEVALAWMAHHPEELRELYGTIVSDEIFDERFDCIQRTCHDPAEFLRKASIDYFAPQDAASLPLPGNSIDIHFSVTVLEHIPEPVIRRIFLEARRVLTDNGLAIHMVDPSDHFQHTDRSISSINFLRYSDRRWSMIAHNRFAYCNRLRASDFRRLFSEQGWRIVGFESTVDLEALAALQSGFVVAKEFHNYEHDDLATTSLTALLAQA